MSPPSWQYWPDVVGGDVDIASFSSNGDSTINPGTQVHTNLEATTLAGDGGLLWDGRGTTSAIELKGIPSPDLFYMYFDDATDTASAHSQFSSFTLSDTTDLVDYALTTSVDSPNTRIIFTTSSNSVWVTGNSYVLRGVP